MELLVCIKQVPDDSVEISLDPVSKTPALQGVTPVVNAFDTYALEMAARLKEAHGGEITVVSIGGEDVKNSLKNCLAVGADNAYLVKDEAAFSHDPTGIAKTLKKAIGEIEKDKGKPFDLIFCGKESTDYASSQVGLFLGEECSLPVAANVISVEPVEGGIKLKQETEEGYRVMEAALPCVVTIQKPNYDPRYPTIKSKMAARKKEITELSPIENLESQFKVLQILEPPKRAAGVKIKGDNIQEAVTEAMSVMTKARIF